jgi:methanethiol oxidase
MVKADIGTNEGMELDKDFFVDFSEDGRRAHQVRLQGGDASSDSFCYP